MHAIPVSQVTHQGTACGPPQRLGHAALFDQGRGKGQMTCARRPSPRISAGELPGRTDRPWLSPSNTAEHRREDARRPSLGGSRWPSEDVSRQLDLPKKDGTVHNTVLSHWTNSKKLFLINGLGVVFCFLHPLQNTQGRNACSGLFVFALRISGLLRSPHSFSGNQHDP